MILPPNHSFFLNDDPLNDKHRLDLHVSWGVVENSARKHGFFTRLKQGLKSLEYDLSILCYDDRCEHHESIFYECNQNLNGSIRHSARSKAKLLRGASQSASFYPQYIPSDSSRMVLTLSHFSGANFQDINAIECRFINPHTGKEIVKIANTAGSSHSAIILGVMERFEHGWCLTAMDDRSHCTHMEELVEKGKGILSNHKASGFY